MNKTLLLALSLLFPVLLSAVTLTENAGNFTVSNDNYEVTCGKSTGFAVKINKVGKTAVPSALAAPEFNIDNDLEKYDGRYNPSPASTANFRTKAVCKVLKNTPSEIQLEVSYNFYGGKVTEIITFDNSCAVNYTVKAANNVRLFSHNFQVRMVPGDKKGIFLPDMKRVQGLWQSHGTAMEGAGWRAAWYGKKKTGIGIAVPEHKDLRGIEYSMQGGIKDGWGTSRAKLTAVYGSLQKYGKTGEHSFNYTLLIGNNAKKIQETAEKIVGKAPENEIFSYTLKKLAVRPGEGNFIVTEIRNNSNTKADLTLKSTVSYGLDSEKSLGDFKISLAPNAFKTFEIPVKFPADLKKGAAVRSNLVDSDGKIIASAVDFCTVTDRTIRDTGFGIVNAAQAYQEGSEFAWSRNFKSKYVGNFEYYCWMPSTIFGLAPEEDSWLPHTEAHYNTPITKKFVKALNKEAKAQGVGVYSMVTGLWNYQKGIQHPAWLQYAKSGQPLVYNGRMRPNGARRATLKANMFYPDRAAQWGNEMADSIDMFGWAGCRWDWNFLPNVMSDPLYMGEFVDDWYDHKGIPQSKLFPDPDKTGVECLQAWRAAVAKRHPDFVYGTNYGSAEEEWKKTPGYHKESATNSMVLFEDMLGYSAKKFSTFEKWGSELRKRCDLVRRYGASPVVGAMRGLNPGSISYDLAQYTSASAGVKWMIYYTVDLLDGEAERNRFFLRFAEYYYNPEFLQGKADNIKLENPAKVLWKTFIRERKTANGREIIMPLVNQPDKDDFICQHHPQMSSRKNLTFSVKPRKGEKIDSVWLMTPQSPEKAVKLHVKNGNFIVTELKNAAMILVRLKGN